jgi:5-methyltetrahydrofolate--homocysteine methyltransferase
MVNSITGEKQRMEEIVPIVKEFGTRIVCLLMDDSGLLSGVDERTKLAADLAAAIEKEGVGNDRLYFDPCVRPVSTEPDQGTSGLEVVSWISKELSGAHTTCGLSNVSFGLPNRSILNAAYLAMMTNAGLDSVIIDPLNETVMDSLRSARALLGQDEMCMEYIQAERAK